MLFLLPFRWEFCFQTLLPSAEHPPDFLEFLREAEILPLVDEMILSPDLEEEFQEIGLADDGDQILDFRLRFRVLCPKEKLERIKEKGIDFSAERVPMNLRNMENDILPRLVGGLQSHQDADLACFCGGGIPKCSHIKTKKKLAVSYHSIIAPENLLVAWEEFLHGKRTRKDVQAFELHLMDNLLALHEDLKERTYRHGGYEAFQVNDPKPRDIHKASVRDRIVHRALYRVLYPFFDDVFIADSYSCRIDKGTHRALRWFEVFARKVSHNRTKTVWVLKGDIRKFFASIDHEILLGILRERIVDEDILWLMREVIGSFPQPLPALPLESGGGRRGVPLGNLTSQLFANVYLNELDQFVKHELEAKWYIRYADDFVILSCEKEWLENILPRIEVFLCEQLKLELHPDKLFLKTGASGVDFLGWVHFPDHRVLRSVTKRRMFRKVNEENGASYLGLLGHGNGCKLKVAITERAGRNESEDSIKTETL